ncbi:MAG: response regulator, partial [Hyphomicrobiales bacterium]
MKPVIVFVDDEPNILQGIRRYTRSQRGSWDMHFLESGRAAMELVTQTPVDVIVSDMRMPEITGADLLEHISHEAPGIIRLILSGEAEEAQTHRTIGRSHRFIAKPCDPTILINEINAILSLRQ